MTMPYVEMTANDLQRELRLARSSLAISSHTPWRHITPRAGLDGIVESLLFAQPAILMFVDRCRKALRGAASAAFLIG